MKQIAVSQVILDFGIYPRADVDPQHVHYICAAMASGHELPPIVIDKASRRVVDGFHRVRAAIRLHGKDAMIAVIEKAYASEKELFLDCVRYNATHGRTLTQFDRAHCIIRGDELQIEPDELASALCLSSERLGELRTERVGKLRRGTSIPLKRTIGHMAGKTLTKAQFEANDKLSGMNQSFYAGQLITLIENDLLDTANDELMERLRRLNELLDGILAKV